MTYAITLSPNHPKVNLDTDIKAFGTVGIYDINIGNGLEPETIEAAVFGAAGTNFTIIVSDDVNCIGASKYDVGIALGAAATITNFSGIRGDTGIAIFGTSGTSLVRNNGNIVGFYGPGIFTESVADITNSGYIGSFEDGVILQTGGTIINTGGVTGPLPFIYSKYEFGVLAEGPATIRNTGYIKAGAGGVQLGSGGSVNNSGRIYQFNPGTFAAVELIAAGSVNNSGTLHGSNGIKFQATASSGSAFITNTGYVSAACTLSLTSSLSHGFLNYGIGIYSNLAGTVTNHGTILGNHAGIFFKSAAAIIDNTGLITSGASYGVYIGGGGTVINSGTIYGFQEGVFAGNDATALTPTSAPDFVLNTGLIAAAEPPFAGRYTNVSTGRLFTYSSVALFQLAPGTIDNAGTVSDPGGIGIFLDAIDENFSNGTSTFTNGALINTGTVAARYGMEFAGYAGVTNSGKVLGTDIALLTEVAGAQIDNTGLLSASASFSNRYDVFPATAVFMEQSATLTNAGTITAPHGIGVYAEFGGTIIDTGTISGGAYAISFASGFANRLVIDAASRITGAVNGGGGILEFAADGTKTGTFTAAMATQFANFASLQIDAKSVWDFAGSQTLSAPILNNGTIKESAKDILTIDSALTGTGLIDISKNALTLNGSVASGEKIAFGGTNETLNLGDPLAFKGKIEKFKTTDTIDLTSLKLSDIVGTNFVKSVLTIITNTETLHLAFASPGSFGTDTFQFFNDGTGTGITLAPPAALAGLLPHPLATTGTTPAPLVTFSP